MGRKVVIRKVDMDTALTALLLGVTGADEIVVSREGAGREALEDPEVICIECGGSGQIHLNNFDHHDTPEELPPACRQAFEALFLRDPWRWSARNPEEWGRMMGPLEFTIAAHRFPDLPSDFDRRVAVQQEIERLVDYVSFLDIQGPEALKERSKLPKETFPTLSDVFSGMLLVTKDPKEQLLKGMEILRLVLTKGLDPFGLMPELPEWKEYIEAKRGNMELLREAISKAEFFETKGGLKAGFLETEAVGALGALYSLGCQVAVVYSPKFGDPPVPKYTIGGNGVQVDVLKPVLDKLEPGWGGPAHGTVLGSPFKGSRLRPEEVKEIVRENL